MAKVKRIKCRRFVIRKLKRADGGTYYGEVLETYFRKVPVKREKK